MAVRVSQEAAEAVLSSSAANVRVTQEVLEVVLGPAASTANVRVSQEVLEAVVPYGPPPEEEASFVVEPEPLVRWRATVPADGFVVEPTPRVVWNGELTDPFTRFTVHTAPVVKWNTGTGAATTECIGGEGEIPPPDEPPAASGEENYVF